MSPAHDGLMLPGDEGTAGVDSDALRALVREALREALPALLSGQANPSPPAGGVAPAGPGTHRPLPPEVVTLRNDAELSAFVDRLIRMFDDPFQREELRSGRLRFSLDGGPARELSPQVRRIDKGAVTESVVREAARQGDQLILGPDAVLTPLARDRARADGVTIHHERRREN
jgi:hypothetical protein